MKTKLIILLIIACFLWIICGAILRIKQSKHPNENIELKHLNSISSNVNKPDTATIYQKDSIVFIKINKMFYRAKLE